METMSVGILEIGLTLVAGLGMSNPVVLIGIPVLFTLFK